MTDRTRFATARCRRVPARHRAVALVALLTALAVTGCARSPQPTSAPPAASGDPVHADPARSEQPIAGLVDMPDSKKRAELNPQFQVEWPVVDGDVTSSQTVSERELRYELVVPAPIDRVAQWHREVFAARAFTLLREAQSDSGGLVLEYDRAGVGYTVRIEPETDDRAKVSATLRLNNAVPPAQ